MKKKSLIAIALILLMTASLLVSCNGGGGESSAAASNPAESKPASEAESSAEEQKGPLDHLDTVDLDKDVVFLVNTATDVANGYRSIEIYPNDEDVKYTYMNEYVVARNRMVEEKLGVRISEIRTTAMTTDINNALSVGSDEFQIVCPWMTDAGPLVTSSAFYDLYEFKDIINFDGAYWDQNANKSLSIDGKLYFTTGDFSLLSMDVTHCMVFNRDVISEYNLEDPYQLVYDGKWTYDKMMELCHSVTAETDGEDGTSYKDNIGLFINTNYANSLFIGSGQRFVMKDSSDIPYLAIYNDTATSVVQKITDIFHSPDAINIESFNSQAIADGFTNCYWAARDAIANKRGLICAISLSDIINLSNTYDCNFGLLVTPKYTEDQDNYYSYISVIYATACAIPRSNDDPETAALVLEALNAASTDTTKKNYYERVLKAQKLRDEEGEEMLDFIFNNRVYDLGAIYNWGGIRDFLNSICSGGTDQFASKYEANEDIIKSAIEDTVNYMS